MEGALVEVFGTAGDADYRYDGKTDRQIAREQMRASGFDDAPIDQRIVSSSSATLPQTFIAVAPSVYVQSV